MDKVDNDTYNLSYQKGEGPNEAPCRFFETVSIPADPFIEAINQTLDDYFELLDMVLEQYPNYKATAILQNYFAERRTLKNNAFDESYGIIHWERIWCL